MSQRLTQSCLHKAEMWAHRGEKPHHTWAEGDESKCSCQPVLMCGVCHNSVLQEHGFLLLDETALPAQAAVFLN